MIPAPALDAPTGATDDPQVRFDRFERDLTALLEARAPSRIRAELARGCWVHGAGLYGRRLAGLLGASGFDVLGFIDRRGGSELSEVMDRPVVHPDAFRPEDAEGRAFVGGVLNPAAASSDMLAWARGLPFAAVACGADLPDALGEAAATCWLAGRALIRENLPRIQRVFLQLADEASRDVYLGVLRHRLTGDPEDHPAVDAETPYLPPDLPGFDRPVVFVDAGAYTGDTCELLLRRGVEIRRYVAFEPDRRNYERLARFVRTAPVAEATLLPCGLADRFRIVSFLDGQELSSRIVETDDPSGAVACLGLDEALPGLSPDFVKMDIEGAEMAALQGMAGMIERCRPRLAVSIYHKPEDLWDLPEWVGRRYGRLHVRQHGRHGFDTVLYALP